MSRRIRCGFLLGGALLASSCGTGDVASAESALVESFLQPASAAGLAVVVEDTCHLERQVDSEPWHLEVRVQLDADPSEVAELLDAEGVVVSGAREPFDVQQVGGDPAHGWNGVLESSEGDATLGLTYNNVQPDSLADAGGWAEVCGLASQ